MAVRSATTSGEVVTDGVLRWTDRTRTALDLVRRGPLDEAVVLLDRLVQWHGRPEQLTKDRARMNRLLAAGWRVLFVTAADLRDPSALVARIAAALSS